MAFTQHGSTSYSFGFNDTEASAIAAACGLKPQTLDISSEPEFQAEAENEDGEVVSKVVGPDKITFTMSGYITDATLFNSAGSFTFRTKKFILTGRKETTGNRDFKKGEMSGESYANIAAAGGGG